MPLQSTHHNQLARTNMNKKRLLVSYCSLFLLGIAASTSVLGAQPTVTVVHAGTTYRISSQLLTHTGDAATLTSQPWWGDAALSNALAGLVEMQAGGFQGNPGDPLGALFAYGTNGGSVSIAYWLDPGSVVVDCPIGCPNVNDPYFYATLVEALQEITLSSVRQSLLSSNSGLESINTNVNMMLHGAHSRPMSRRVAVDEKTAWLAGDWGQDDHGSNDGSVGMAEIGGGYNFGPVQINLSVGKTWTNQNLSFNGDMDAKGHYVMTEGILPISEARGIYATVGAYGHWGEIDIRRGYLNGVVLDASTANPDTNTWGLRARLDWEKAFVIKSTEFSPYLDLSYNRSHMESYTEEGGSLPARFDGRTDKNTELRLGMNSSVPISRTSLYLIGNIEAAHRLDNDGPRTSGQVLGLFAFNLEGEESHSNWVKVGIGVEGLLAGGKASVMLNGTTKSDMPNAWLAASYQLTF